MDNNQSDNYSTKTARKKPIRRITRFPRHQRKTRFRNKRKYFLNTIIFLKILIPSNQKFINVRFARLLILILNLFSTRKEIPQFPWNSSLWNYSNAEYYKYQLWSTHKSSIEYLVLLFHWCNSKSPWRSQEFSKSKTKNTK